ncbi:hypothetical protein NLG97_g8596 [Lecanicillium saksenae]|uniref:Uncharacterized protein n=1 Tax=Lecanicillium saksenae TaxID=468837 RepID=A0ACC1QL39_9HYPO|nr:hypothetical protein NLG97_g8596 [Lecanicillium saksenae]
MASGSPCIVEKPLTSLRQAFSRLFGARDALDASDGEGKATPTWNFGVLNGPHAVEVPGSVLLFAGNRNEPFSLRDMHARTSHSSIPAGFSVEMPSTTNGISLSVASEETPVKTTGDGQIILIPQPDDSANDPLNWPSWRRDTALLSLGCYCMIGGGVGPLIASGFTEVAAEYHVKVESVALTTGLYMMGLGIGSVFASPTAILYGKRPVYLASSICFIAATLWAAWSPSFGSLVAARVVQGMAVSPSECLPSATIAELFFLHERAFRIGIYTLLLLGGKNLGPLASAAIIGRFGWRWVFWTLAIIVFFASILLFLFVPETFWDRTPTRNQGGPRTPKLLRRRSSPPPHAVKSCLSDIEKLDSDELVTTRCEDRHAPAQFDHSSGGNDREMPTSCASTLTVYTRQLQQKPALSFTQQLKPYSSRLNNDSWIRVLIRPFVLFAYPAVLWAAVVYSCSIGWLLVIAETIAMIYRNPATYDFTALQTGLVYISPFVGAVLGTAVAGRVSDVIVQSMARRNGGLYEPEFRLVMAIPILLTTGIGLMGFGWSAQLHNHWIVPTVFFGILSFGCSLGSTTSITFCVDSYRQYASEALVTLNVAKNIMHGLVFCFFINHWIVEDGPKMVYVWIGVIQVLLLLMTIPLYIYGKRLRMWTVRRNVMEKL